MYPGLAHRLYACIARPAYACCRSRQKRVAEAAAHVMMKAADAVPSEMVRQKTRGLLVRTVMPHTRVNRSPEDAPERTPVQLAMGVQWAVRNVHGCEGDTLQLSIVRDPSVASTAVKLRVWGQDVTEKCRKTVRGIGEQDVAMEAGQTHATCTFKLEHVQTGSLNLKSGVWQPQRSFHLHLDMAAQSQGQVRCK